MNLVSPLRLAPARSEIKFALAFWRWVLAEKPDYAEPTECFRETVAFLRQILVSLQA